VARTAGAWKTRLSDDPLSIQVHAHAGSGHIFVRVSNASLESLESSWERLRAELERTEGTAEILDAPTALKSRVPLWCGSAGPIELMKSLKDCFDPAGALSPGRMDFGR
jgi:FAD/FMN-containing dehydrogenase